MATAISKPAVGVSVKLSGDDAVIAELRKLGFSDVVSEVPHRIVGSIQGLEGTGKSHFCLTAPSPIVYYNIDVGTEGVVEKFQKGFEDQEAKQVLIRDIRVPKDADKDTYDNLWAGVKQSVSVAYQLKRGTVIFDTGSEAHELCRLAHFGKLTQILPHHYTVVNTDWREFMRLAYDSPMNTMFIHKIKPKYVNNVRTNEYEMSGMSEIPYLVQVILSSFRVDSEGGPEFGVKILKCRQNPQLTGQVLQGPMCSFDFLLGLVHG